MLNITGILVNKEALSWKNIIQILLPEQIPSLMDVPASISSRVVQPEHRQLRRLRHRVWEIFSPVPPDTF